MIATEFGIAELRSSQMNSISGPKNTPSKLLSQDENEILFRLLGTRCQTQCSAVVQLFATEGPTHSSWLKKYCGVVTFTKDSNRRSYFIQVYDIVKEQKLYEQELYNQFSYHVSMPFFHQFEGENYMVGLNFADNEEADAFDQTISDRQASKLRKKEERRRQQQVELNQNQQQLHHQQNQQRSLQPINSQSNLSISSQSLNKTKIKKGRRTNKLSKDQIGEPTNFQHITHVGFDQDKGITVNGEDEALHDFFKLAGVSDNLLKDDSTRKFIYDFIDQHGGVERATEETKVYGSIKRTPSSSSTATKPVLPSRNSISGGVIPPQPPPRPQQPIHSHPQSAPPPPPPPKDRGNQDRPVAPQPPPPPSTLQPLSVANSTAHPPPPPPPRIPSGTSVAPPPRGPVPSGIIVPPPPPLPPIHGTQRHSIPANVPSIPHQELNSRNDLLAQIRQRPTLNPISLKKIEKPETDTRTNLMSEIRKREYELKPVTPIEGDVSPGFAAPAENTMAAMLARALEGRAKAIQNESDTDEDDEEDEDEWDDN